MTHPNDKPILLYPSKALELGVEAALLMARLEDMTHYRSGQTSNGKEWFSIPKEQLQEALPFWDVLDLQRIVQQLRDHNQLLVRSAPLSEDKTLYFAFNQIDRTIPQNPRETRQLNRPAQLIGDSWKPGDDVYDNLSQLGIPRHFANECIPQFVQYWRDRGSPQHSWGAKFISDVKRKWEYKVQDIARKQQAQPLPSQWQPSDTVLQQLAQEGIPSAFVNKSQARFMQYHSQSGTTQKDWGMSFFSWVKEDWSKQDTPFLDKKQSTPMRPNWQPAQHTIDYLRFSCAIDLPFINDCIPEFIHKWMEKNAFYSEWGTLFAEHVSQQWRFVKAGIKQNPDPVPMDKNWNPSADCMEVLIRQVDIPREFIDAQVPEFILYWTNRAEPRHSWDNVFLHHIKRQWANYHEQQYAPAKTRDSSIAERLADTSWAK